MTGIITEFAPAKINLYLHITGRRADGYHDLDSLVAFAGIGDEVRLEPAAQFSFTLEGPQAGALAHEPADTNLVAKAAWTLANMTHKPLNVALKLIKNLPVASGIGGGSSDAAAALRALARHWGLDPAEARVFQAAAKHGQDVPVCLEIASNYIMADRTVGAHHAIPHADIVLVNPNKALSTPLVYRDFRDNDLPFSSVARIADDPLDLYALIRELKQRRNDLYIPACRLMPEIGNIIQAIEASDGCLLARMSGSGATCFGMYGTAAAAKAAAAGIKAAHPGWWVKPTNIPYFAKTPK